MYRVDDMLLEAGKKYFSGAVGQERLRLSRQTDFQGSHWTAALPILVPESCFAFLPDGKLWPGYRSWEAIIFQRTKEWVTGKCWGGLKSSRCVAGDTHLSRRRVERRCWSSSGVGSSAAQLWVSRWPQRHCGRWHVPWWWMLLLGLLLLQSWSICSQKMRMRNRKSPVLICHGLSDANAMGIPL